MRKTVTISLMLIMAYSRAWAGEMQAQYLPPTPQYLEAYTWMARNNVLGAYAEVFDTMFKLPENVSLAGKQCDKENAFYDPNTKTVTVCYELVKHIMSTFSDIKDQQERETAVLGTLTFIVLHEFGHMLINLLDLPAVGREEDSVDQFSAVIMLKGNDAVGPKGILYSAEFWKTFRPCFGFDCEHWRDVLSGNNRFADVHGLDQQRYYNLLCYAYGRNPSNSQWLLQKGRLPSVRAQDCPNEYQRAHRAWGRLLMPHFEPGVNW